MAFSRGLPGTAGCHVGPFIEAPPSHARVLDIGCGIGVLARMITRLRDEINVDAVDFEEMIQVARTYPNQPRIRYFCQAAEQYFPSERIYDLTLSAGCYSAIKNIDNLREALINAFKMTAD